MSEEEMFFEFLQQYIEEGNFPDYSGEYPNPYELTIDDAKLILNLKEKQIKKIEKLHSIIKEVREYIKRKDICIDTRKTDGSMDYVDLEKELLEILDKVKEI